MVVREQAETKARYLTVQELAELIDSQSREYLGISGMEFASQNKAWRLDDRFIVQRLRTLLSLAENKRKRQLIQALRNHAE